ncbi:MAG: circularly permuted type 2 ATP-grasp protein [Coriobacteriaceae bacterium]|nr:circularly permuted type 2 ATP-grasp protein [Coriobacteriaceae bacterium]
MDTSSEERDEGVATPHLLIQHAEAVNRLMERYGVRFGVGKDGKFEERLFPFDPLPRLIQEDEWKPLERGLVQRVQALNCFLFDIYTDKRIVRDGVIDAEFAFNSSGYLGPCEGIVAPKKIMSHISGIDLVQGRDGTWYALEDNLRIPSGASYPLIARELTRKASPKTFRENTMYDNRDYGERLRKTMDYVNCGGINVILTPGRYNAAFFEHSYLSEVSDAVLAFPNELYVEDEKLYFRGYQGKAQRVGAVYRRLSDEYLDPTTFLTESVIGIPNLMSAYRAGNVAILNAPGNGVADDKGIYYHVPKLIEYYLGEEPILANAPTYLAADESDLSYILEHLSELVIKDVSQAGGYGVIFGSDLSKQHLDDLRDLIKRNPRRWIAQDTIDFQELPVLPQDDPNEFRPERKADLRAFVLSGETTEVWPSGLTRFAREAGSSVVNSSQGGGFKDTWVLLSQ